jgi:hypothetical protein
MEATEKEQQLLTRIFHSNIIIGILIIMFGFLVFSKTEAPDFRPINVTTRSVATGTAYQPSTSRYTNVTVSVQVACALTLSGGAAGGVSLQTSPDNITYTTVQQLTNANSGTLTVGLGITNTNGAILSVMLPPGYYYKLVTNTTTGTPVFSVLTSAQEVQL